MTNPVKPADEKPKRMQDISAPGGKPGSDDPDTQPEDAPADGDTIAELGDELGGPA